MPSWLVATTRPSPLTARISPETLGRLQAETARLDVSVNACVLHAGRQLAALLESGWRPRGRQCGPSTAQILLRISPEERRTLEVACTNAGVELADFIRLAATAALQKVEGQKQILWPPDFSKAAFNAAMRDLSAPG